MRNLQHRINLLAFSFGFNPAPRLIRFRTRLDADRQSCLWENHWPDVLMIFDYKIILVWFQHHVRMMRLSEGEKLGAVLQAWFCCQATVM
jgi:hypothetical protein